MAVDTNNAENIRKFGEGKLNTDSVARATIPPSTFVRMIVKDVISDPNNELTKENKEKWQAMGITNMNYADTLPRNTIIAKKVGEDVSPMFVFPFFPSHLSLPCKPGECVWVMFEKPHAPLSDMAFWFCRIVEPHTSDDVNHSHPGRTFEPSLNPGAKERLENEKNGKVETGENIWHELRNGPVVTIGKDKDRVTSREVTILKGEDEDVFENLVMTSDASYLMTYESVPRFRKRPGDIALEGSNNTLIVLGTERIGAISEPNPRFNKDNGVIDIIAGRGQTPGTYGKSASTTWMKDAKGHEKGTEIKKELNKSLDMISPNEGEPDFRNDRSRIHVAQNTPADLLLGINDYNEKILNFSNSSFYDDSGAIIIKSDKLRLIARSDVEILVTGFTNESSPSGISRMNQNSDSKKWASIVIKSNGDIVLTPSDEGLLKLGGDDANLAVLCSPSIPIKPGEVTASPITDTMGGSLGVTGAAATGTFAKRVVFK